MCVFVWGHVHEQPRHCRYSYLHRWWLLVGASFLPHFPSSPKYFRASQHCAHTCCVQREHHSQSLLSLLLKTPVIALQRFCQSGHVCPQMFLHLSNEAPVTLSCWHAVPCSCVNESCGICESWLVPFYLTSLHHWQLLTCCSHSFKEFVCLFGI